MKKSKTNNQKQIKYLRPLRVRTLFNRLLLIIFILVVAVACQNKLANREAGHELKDDSQKVILITIDGVRWQEIFTGADSLLVVNADYVKNIDSLKQDFWRSNANNRRQVLLPFFWSHIAKKGSIYGNRKFNNKVNVSNNHWFSYPGYNEILCGIADDDRINSNDKINNPNTNILEIINNAERYKGSVAAFCSWDVFPYIINRDRNKIPVNAGFEPVKGENLSDAEKLLNMIQAETPSPWEFLRLDVFTHHYSIEYMKKKHPKLLYIAFGETDDFAHDGKYDAYLHSIKRADNFIKKTWELTQNDPFYKDHTTFIITTDHGRGTKPIDEWKSHGNDLKYGGNTYNIKGSDEVWLAIFGSNMKNLSEVKEKDQLYSNQIAATIAKLLNVNLPLDNEMGKPLF